MNLRSWLTSDPVTLAVGSSAAVVLVSLVVLGGLPSLDTGCNPVGLGPKPTFDFNETTDGTTTAVEIRSDEGDRVRASHTYLQVGKRNHSWAALDDERNVSTIEHGDTVIVDGVRDGQNVRVVWLPKDRYEAPDACEGYSRTVLDSHPPGRERANPTDP